MLERVIEFARQNLDAEGLRTFQDIAFWAAHESGKPTAIPALALVFVATQFVLIAEIVIVAFVARHVMRWVGRNWQTATRYTRKR